MMASRVRIEILDVIRGLAASLVVIHHILRTAPGLSDVDFWETASAWWLRYVFLGDLAVTLFFILSGVSLALSAFAHPDAFTMQTFYTRRFFRIYPLYLLTILICFAFRPIYQIYLDQQWVAADSWLSSQFTSPLSLKTWLGYLTLTFNVFKLPVTFNNVLWSLPIEAQFYLFFPVIFWLLQFRRMRGAALVIILCGIAFLLEKFLLLPGQTLGRLWEFSGGVIMGCYWETAVYYARQTVVRGLALTSAVICFVLARQGFVIPEFPWNTLDVLFGFAVVLLALGWHEWTARRPLEKRLVSIGLWSYSLYMCHNLLLGAFAPPLLQLGLPTGGYVLITLPTIYLLAVLVSRYLYEHFELPFIRQGSVTARRLHPIRPDV